MSRAQRRKGAAFEREVAKQLSLALGMDLRRELGQARDSGADIVVAKPGYLGRWRIECKRRKSLATVEGWMRQAREACTRAGDVPVVVMRSDHGQPMAVMSLALFGVLLDDHMAMCTRNRGTQEDA